MPSINCMLHGKCTGLFGKQLLAAVAHATHNWVSDIWLLVRKQNLQILSDSKERKFATVTISLWFREDLRRAQSPHN
jgi:hypothetical protein